MKGFAAFTPTRILFGAGSLSQLSGKDIPARKVLLVTGVGGSLRRNGTLAKVEAMLAREGVEFVAFPSVEPNPSDETVMKGAEAARENGCGALLAVGGGSVMDAAKLMAAMATNVEPFGTTHRPARAESRLSRTIRFP